MNQLLVRAASNLSVVNISKGRSNRGGVGSIVTRKQNGLSGIGMAVSTGILEESASYTDTDDYQSGEASYRTLVIADATATPEPNHVSGLKRMEIAGIMITNTKGVFCEWARDVPSAARLRDQLGPDLPPGLIL